MENELWTKISDVLPPENELVNTKIDDEKGERNIQTLKRVNNLYFSGGMYVYYTPTHWQRIPKNKK